MDFEAVSLYLISIFNYSFQCIGLPVHTYECFNFWKVVFGFILIVLFLFLCAVVKRILQNKREWNAYQERLLKRTKIADEDVLMKAKWQGDDSFDNINEFELAEAMRQQLKTAKKTK